eukprot:CAMPEP_0119006348 /NCGR_PEP_ID=MMETSP1176-20130426/2247_1 /TAXON_ID=265551 /ORGANISM="Synedropsis recta cf, Strain CCMP1620" /LENGTH=282 /DNA_ID=CAMNT_0006958257 /DNA_START=102 /DNA_END=950 /DNA_ORIENTATION=-
MPLSETREDSMKEPSSFQHEIPAPPPPSPALGAMRCSPSSFRNNLLGKRPVRAERERSQSWGHHSAPSLVITPPYSPIISNTATYPSGHVPFMPNLVINGGSVAAKSAMEQAMQEERTRRICHERAEIHMDASQLRTILKDERIRMSRVAAELAQIKSTAVSSQLESEVCEEGRINLMRRQMENVQQEKGRIILELEREEEMLTNTLQKKLDQVRKEKALLEKKIESEHIAHAALEERLNSVQAITKNHGIEDSIEECEDEGEVDDSILPDLAALGGHDTED